MRILFRSPPAASRRTCIAVCPSGTGIVSALPTCINGMARPQTLDQDDSRLGAVVDYLKAVSAHHGVDLDCRIDGTEAEIWTG